MSLINDALKRAKKSQGRQPAGGQVHPPLQPVGEAPGWRNPTLSASWVLPAAAGLFLVLGAWFLVLSWRHSQTAAQSLLLAAHAELARRPDPAVAPRASSAEPVPVGVVSNAPASPVQTAEAVVDQGPGSAANSVGEVGEGSPGPASQAAPGDEANQPVEEAPGVPEFKLQGIFYRPSNASALIDGHTLFVGDEIDGAKLVLIERQSVRLVKGGRPIVLKLR